VRRFRLQRLSKDGAASGRAAHSNRRRGRPALSRSGPEQLFGRPQASRSEQRFEQREDPIVEIGMDECLILRKSDVLAKIVGTREPAGATA
jgi:hypothetical protein